MATPLGYLKRSRTTGAAMGATAMLNRSVLLDVAMLGVAMLLAASTAFA
jgi:hypothetical protein